MSNKQETRETVAQMARQLQDNSRGKVKPEEARQIAEKAARRADHRERNKRG